jgi:hypothetical protein
MTSEKIDRAHSRIKELELLIYHWKQNDQENIHTKKEKSEA